MMIESVRLVMQAAKREEVRQALVAWRNPVTVEQGCLGCRILQESGDSRSIWYIAEWASEDDLLRHLREDHYKQLLNLMETACQPPLIQFHRVVETAGLELVEQARNAV